MPTSTAPKVIEAMAVGKIRNAFADGQLAAVRTRAANSKLTLAAALELAACDFAELPKEALTVVREFADPCPVYTGARSVLMGKLPRVSADTAVQGDTIEILSLATFQEAEWDRGLQRFSDATAERGLDRKYARALARSFHEMVDNIVQHAAKAGDPLPRCVVGWHAFPRGAAFAVLDLGRGLRTSLAENPLWRDLPSDQDALRSILRRHATRRTNVKEGDGFKDVVKNFVDRNGVLRIRSGNCEVVASGSTSSANEQYSPLPPFPGTRVSAWCRPHDAGPGCEPVVDSP